jgi:GH35 family endo-1,4-beta-xylanase
MPNTLLFPRVLTWAFVLLITAPAGVFAQSNNIQWYNQAQQRIDTLRKGPFSIDIIDQNGTPYTGPVKIRLKKHEFDFGVAFDFYEGDLITDVPTQTQWTQATMYKYFNYGVNENSFKWSGIQAQRNNLTYETFERALNWAEKVGWEMRAHTLLWGGTNYEDDHPTPRWVKDLSTPEDMLAACEERVKRDIGRYKGRVKEYDVVNEPVHATYLQSLVGDSLNWKAFQWAREADPDAALFINEYNVEYSWGNADRYLELIQKILDMGGPVSGIGMQSHFWDCCRPDIASFVTQINKLASLGLPVRLTEFDYGGNLTEAEQAEDFIKVMTIAFSHPAITGVIYWSMSDRNAWRENSGLFRTDNRPKLAADTLLYLTQNLWSTQIDTVVSASEALQFQAYYGDYLIEVPFEGGTKEFVVPFTKANRNTHFTLRESEATVKSPDLVAARMDSLDELELTFDVPLNPETIDRYNFRVFTSNGLFVQQAGLKPDEPHKLILKMSSGVSVLDHITVSYFPGSLKGTNGGMARAFGTETVVIPASLNQPPVAEDQVFSLVERSPALSEVGFVQATDPEGSSLAFRIVGGSGVGAIGINPSTGRLVVTNQNLINSQNTPLVLLVEISDGTFTVTVTITVHIEQVLSLDADQVYETLLYPNPTHHQFHISAGAGIEGVEIYDLRGKRIFQQVYAAKPTDITLVPYLQKGMYFVKVMQGSQWVTLKLAIH